MKSIEQQFLSDLEKKLWISADKLRSSLDAAALYIYGPGSYASSPC